MADEKEIHDRIWGELHLHRLVLLQIIGALALSDSKPDAFLAGFKEKSEIWARSMAFPGTTAASRRTMLDQMLKAHADLFGSLETALRDPRNRASA